jgi:hypothetical protein
MTKIAAVALLAMAPVAFGEVTLDLNDTNGDAVRMTPVANGEVLTLTIDLGITGSEAVAGYTYFLHSSVPGAFRITGRTNNSAIIADFTSSNAAVTNALFNSLNPRNGNDLGATGPAIGVPELDAEFAPGLDDIMTITLTAQQDVDAAVISISGSSDVTVASWSDLDGNQTAFASVGTYTILPEPVSALLLVLGGLFVTRRRVA